MESGRTRWVGKIEIVQLRNGSSPNHIRLFTTNINAFVTTNSNSTKNQPTRRDSTNKLCEMNYPIKIARLSSERQNYRLRSEVLRHF